MNKNDKKQHRVQKGIIDPRAVKEYIVFHESELLPFLFEKMPSQSKKNVKRILSNHQVSVGGAPVTQFNFKLYPEDVVVISRNRITKHERKDLPIIYEDEDLIAIDKPSGLLSTATEREKGKTAYRLVSDYITQTNPKARIFVVHRLDEDTSGVLIFAKSWEVREALQNSWQDIVKNRSYYAIVEGEMPKKEDTLRDYLDQDKAQLVYVTENTHRGKLAVTSYKVMAAKKDYSLLDVHIDSGRKNQIRVQLGHTGHFVIGDDKYGEPSDPLKRLGLHAYELDLVNPLNGKEYHFSAPMPPAFKKMFFVKELKQKEKFKAAAEKKPQQPQEKPWPLYSRKGHFAVKRKRIRRHD
jgi:23S rRNA pseudouridine1911/1915/1917 synthase